MRALFSHSPRLAPLPSLDVLPAVAAGHNVTHTVFVQAAAGGQYPNWKEASVLNETLRPLNEVEYCQGVASICDAERPGCPRICAGIVGWADFQDPEVEQLLIADCRVRNFRGIRTGPVCPHPCHHPAQLCQQLTMTSDL